MSRRKLKQSAVATKTARRITKTKGAGIGRSRNRFTWERVAFYDQAEYSYAEHKKRYMED